MSTSVRILRGPRGRRIYPFKFKLTLPEQKRNYKLHCKYKKEWSSN